MSATAWESEDAAAHPPHLKFGMNTLSFLYSRDLKLLEIRSVPLDKRFCVGLSPRTMQYLHDQVHRVASAMLDSAFVFVQKSPAASEGEEGGVEAYCLSHPSWGTGAASGSGSRPSSCDTLAGTPSSYSPPSTAPCSSSTDGGANKRRRRMRHIQAHPPSLPEIQKEAFMRRILDEEQVQAAFGRFQRSPKAQYACDNADESVEDQMENEDHIDEILEILPDPTLRMKRHADSRRAAVSVDCTLATYEERFGDGRWMGEMMLEGVVNVPIDRFFAPVHGHDLGTLIHEAMRRARIKCIEGQLKSRLILGRTATRGTLHRFSEGSLCKPVSLYEADGFGILHDAL